MRELAIIGIGQTSVDEHSGAEWHSVSPFELTK
jgi:hypothetical protein